MTRELLKQMPDLSEPQRAQLTRTSPHAFRHTFGTQTVASGVPLDVTQRVMGHASVQTTTVYVTAEQQRMRRELGAYFGKLDPPVTQAVPTSPPATRLKPVQPIVDVAGATHVATVILFMQIENNTKHGHGRKHAREAVEYAVLSHYDAKRLRSGEYELSVPYGTDAQLDALIDDLLRSIEMEAGERDCYSSSAVRLADSDRVWG
ncbi:site-specific integrase [Paraburkholderia megapolitana]|uniref:site-specific integrase n=1 Tax=Paraburkholderia megapolitana TaxID=420953 RepID=UPI0038BA28AB